MLNKLKGFTTGSLLRRNVSMTLSRQMLAALAQFILVVVIARELGPEGNGIYALAILLPTMLATFLNLGVGPATVYHVSRKDFDAAHVVAGNLRMGLIVSIAGVAVTLPVLWSWGEQVFPGVPSALLYLGLLSFPVTLLLAYLSTVFQGQENFKVFNLTVLMPPYVNLFAVLVALYVFDWGILGALWAYIIGQLIGLVAVLVFLYRDKVLIRKPEDKSSLTDYTRKSLSYGWKAHLSNILAFVNYRADIFLVNLFLNPAATGVYVIAVQIAEKLWMLSQAASTVLLPRLSAMHTTPQARLDLTNKGFILVSLLTLGLSGMVAIALYWLIVPVFGSAYADAWLAFMWLLPGIIAGAGSRIYSNCIAAAGKPEWNMYVAFAVVAINITGNIILIPDYGIVGAAIATSIAYCFNAAVKVWLVKRTLELVA